MEETTQVPEKLTQKKLQEIRDGVLIQYTESIKRANELFNSWELCVNKYDINVLKIQYWLDIDIYWDELEDLEEDVAKIKKELEKNKDKIGICVDETHSDWDDYSSAEHRFEVKRYTIYTLGEVKWFMKTLVISKVSDMLNNDINYRNKNNEYIHTVDCKMLELFDEWGIDYETLLKITYSDCKL